MKVLAIDPGERVGWATAEVRTAVRLLSDPLAESQVPSPAVRTEDFRELVLIDHGISGLRDFAVTLAARIHTYDVVIWEHYRISPNKVRAHIGSDVPTLQLIGMIRLLGWTHADVKMVKQQPAHKATALRTLNHPAIELALKKMPKAHDDGHDGDALLHLWHWFWKEYV